MNINPGAAGGLQFIQPLAVSFQIDGRDITITPLVLRELPAFLGLALPAFSALPAVDAGFFERMEKNQLTAAEISSLITAIAVSGGDLIKLLALCTRQDADWLGGLLMDRAAELVAVSFQVNVDFFQRAIPLLQAMAARMQAPAPLGASAAPTPAEPGPAPPGRSAMPTPSTSS